jgi:4-diphosphocytidyl-2C-methyl-D-erythritol kinase
VRELNIKLTNVIFIIVYPNIHISTAWAYSLVNDFKPKGINENNLSEGSGGVDFLKKIVYNKFQFIVFENCQELRDIKEELDGFLDSHLSFMSGSGSSLVFVYSERGKARHDLEILHKKYPFKAFLCKPFYRETKRNARLIEMQECYF